MNNLAIKKLVDNALSDIIECIEEDRYYPSIREAGSAPSVSAVENAQNILDTLIGNLSDYKCDIDMFKIRKGLDLEEIKSSITLGNYQSFDELEEVDSYTEDNGERKYNYNTTVFLHKSSGKHIAVTVQECARSQEDLDIISISETEKKEVTVTKWI